MAAKAAQTGALATIMSTPCALRGEAAGRKMSGGAAPVTLAEAGKEITREGATVALMERLLLQGRGVVAMAGGAGAGAAHVPAVAAAVDALAQQRHAVQPMTCTADAAQQQPPRQVLVPQSAAEAQGSPGEKRVQTPEPGAQETQPAAAAAALQQKPPKQAPETQEELDTQAAPGGIATVGGVEMVPPPLLM